ncbi:hypothetical protein [Megasphaera elsdenii]|uniref:Uncharacterized protein n=1 Tax=Megasphaera elsdenii TaxID=907 RepID=A0A2S0M9D4_MEGEL|nr:hypothetical protein [Megasphaera elsdenii]AVO28078.1 hypothetical protein C6Y28_10810 [Megasphaera elsdenii]
MAEYKKQVLTFPDLPTAIQGDGRQLISLLRKYLKSVNEQVNVANGFTADDVDASTKGDFPMPRNFTLMFDRLGGVLNWDAVDDADLAYYEVRTNADVGNSYGLLEKTVATSSLVIPTTASGKIYLFAISKHGKVSNGRTITYNKRRPSAPSDISLTKNNEGTLITFLEIPSNCIGANLYIDGQKYQTVDNVFLYPSPDIKELYIAYYDQFGEGERAYLSCFVPNVTGFWVEKNGANLYFYWDALSIYNIKYVVKVGQTQKWEQGTEIFRSKVNKYRYIRPNEGNYYFMIKAVDDHGNYSTDASWYYLSSDPEINKNIILDYNQYKLGYSGIKTNMYYNAAMEGLRLEKESFNGEYLMKVLLPQKIKARNWIDCKINAVTEQTLRVCDMTFTVDSYEASHILVCGILGDMDGVELKKQIARYTGKLDDTFDAIIDGTSKATGGELLIEKNTSYTPVRWNDGALITDVGQLEYSCNIPEKFSIGFWFKNTAPLTDCIIAELRGNAPNQMDYIAVKDMTFIVDSYEARHLGADGIWRDINLYIGYDKRLDSFYVRDTVNERILYLRLDTADRDWLFFGLSQSVDKRLFFIREFDLDITKYVKAFIPPCTSFNRIFFNPKE